MRATNLAQGAGRDAGQRDARPSVREAPKAEFSVTALIERLRRDLGDHYDRYFLTQARVSIRDGGVVVTVSSTYLAEMLERRFGKQVREAAAGVARTQDLPVTFITDRAAFDSTGAPLGKATPLTPPTPPAAPAPASKSVDVFKYRFDNFIVGRANRLAYSAAIRLADDETPVPPIFLHGTCGLGKTHLLRAAASRFQEKRPGAIVRYLTAEQFTNEFVQSVRNNRVDQFRRAYRRVDLLCIDDVHFFANKDATQTELLHTLDAVQVDGARLLLASDEHPKEIAKLSERLVSRFMAGAVVRIDMPDAELREKLVRALSERRGLAIEEEAIRLVAERSARCIGSLGGFGGSVREIEGLLNQIDAVHRLLTDTSDGAKIGVVLVRRALGLDDSGAGASPHAASPGRLRRPVTAEAIVTEVCRELAVELPDFMGKGRHKRVVLARSLVASLSRKLTTMSFPEIARAMGRSNHSTIITAQRRIDRQLAEDTGKPLSAELAAGHAGSTLRELAGLLTKNLQHAS